MNPFLWLVHAVITLYIWILIAAAVLSWLVAFNVVNRYNPTVRIIGDTLFRLTERLLCPIRHGPRLVPSSGAAAAPDSQRAAQPRRPRHLAGDPDPGAPVPRAGHLLDLRVVTAGRPWKIMPDGILLAVRATPKGGRDG